MAPIKRSYPVMEASAPTSYDELGLRLGIDASLQAKLDLCASPIAKKLKADSSPDSSISLSGYLDYDSEPDALVPSAGDLVAAETAWLSTPPGSPAHVPSFDDETSPLKYPDDPGSGSLFGEDAEELENAFDAALLDASHEDIDARFNSLREDQIMLTIDTEALHSVPAAPPPSRESTPSPDLFSVADLQEDAVMQVSLAPVVPTKKAKVPKAKTAAPKAKAEKKAAKAAAAIVKAAAVAQSAAMAADGIDESDKAKSNRWIHNTTERKRRCEIRKLFGDLRDLFPDLAGDDRTANITTLTHAIAHVAELQRLDGIQAQEISMMRDRNAFLKSQATQRQQFEQQQAAQQQRLFEQQQADAARLAAMAPAPIATATSPVPATATATVPAATDPIEAFEKGALPLAAAAVAADPALRAKLPPALRELLDHNGRGTAEILPPRRQKARASVVF